MPRNSFRSASVYRLDLRLVRVVKAGRHAIEPSFELFNVFNRRNLDPTTYNTNLGSARFGVAGRSRNLPYLPRQVQLGIRYSF